MMISDIRLQHFRSYGDAAFEFTPGVNIIVGANGSGKTNLLESLLVVARGSSYRARDSELIQHDQTWARLDAHVDDLVRTLKLTSGPDAEGAPKITKTYEIEGRTFRRLSAAKILPIVLFEPNHLHMLTGSPELRRSYLDDLLSQINPTYDRTRKDYQRVLSQRNALLKRLGTDAASQIFPWNIRLSELGGVMSEGRLQLLQRLNQNASELYSSLAHTDSVVELRYETKLPVDSYPTALLRALETGFQLDAARGFTGAGPHREDMTVLIHGRSAQATASRGEARTAVLMLKVMELRLVEEARAERPILLLDDVFSELDGRRRQALTSYLQDYQTFITTTDADALVEHFMERCTIIPLG